MPLTIEQKQYINDKTRGKKRLRPVKLNKSGEVKYRNQLLEFDKSLQNSIFKEVVPILQRYEYEYIRDSYNDRLAASFKQLETLYNSIDGPIQEVSSEFVNSANRINKKRFYAAVENSIGIDMQRLVDSEGLTNVLQSSVNENVSLIKSIKNEYFKKIQTIIYNGTIQGNSSKSMIQLISEAGKVNTNRAKIIARDQSSKINSALTRIRSTELGSESYVWRTAEDDRVRPTHKAHNGKIYRWDKPPADTGAPGDDVLCRCVAIPIINTV